MATRGKESILTQNKIFDLVKTALKKKASTKFS